MRKAQSKNEAEDVTSETKTSDTLKVMPHIGFLRILRLCLIKPLCQIIEHLSMLRAKPQGRQRLILKRPMGIVSSDEMDVT